MQRRNFLNMTAAMSLLALPTLAWHSFAAQSKQLPKALNNGDKVGIIAPGTAVSDPDDLAKAAEIISYFGLEAVFAKSVQSGSGYKTRSRKERIEDIEKMFADSAISAVFAIRGGYGAGELLDGIDYQLIKANPKIFAGFSDITALHLAFNKYADLITFHSPVLLSRFNEFTSSSFRKTLFSSEPIGILENPQLVSGARKIFPTRTIVSGSADGILTGGNLTIISSLMGTPWEIETENKILLLEDVGEEPYRIDRMLNQLRLAGKLNKTRGIIFGSCTDCDRKSNIWDLSVGEVLDKYFKPLDCPSFYGLLFGHTENQLTIPMGAYASIDSDAGTIAINEKVTEE